VNLMKITRALLAALLLPPVVASPVAVAAQKPVDSKPSARKSADTRSSETKPGLTGQVSEEAFKKLHELKADAAPPRKGTMIEIEESKAYLSLPPGARAPMPAVIVIHEWWGLNDHIMHWADRLAAEGYAAIAVDLYGGTVAKTSDEAMAAMKKVDDKRAMDTLLAALEFAETDARIQATKLASIGWCFGGTMSLKLALVAPGLDAAVMYYGHPEQDPKALEPLQAPLLGVFGTKDKSIPPEIVKEFDDALAEAKKEHKILSYEAEHAFANPSNPRYDEKNAGEAWAQVRAFLAEHLKGVAAEPEDARSPK